MKKFVVLSFGSERFIGVGVWAGEAEGEEGEGEGGEGAREGEGGTGRKFVFGCVDDGFDAGVVGLTGGIVIV